MFSSQFTCNKQRLIKTLEIRVPTSYQTMFKAPDQWFTAENDDYEWFKVFAPPSDVSIEDNFLGGNQGYEATFTAFRLRQTVAQRGYRVTVRRSESKYFYLMQYIVQTIAQVNVRDYLRPEASDFAAALVPETPLEPYTVRYGTIFELAPVGGLFGTTGDNLFLGENEGGFSFKFQEARAINYASP